MQCGRYRRIEDENKKGTRKNPKATKPSAGMPGLRFDTLHGIEAQAVSGMQTPLSWRGMRALRGRGKAFKSRESGTSNFNEISDVIASIYWKEQIKMPDREYERLEIRRQARITHIRNVLGMNHGRGKKRSELDYLEASHWEFSNLSNPKTSDRMAGKIYIGRNTNIIAIKNI